MLVFIFCLSYYLIAGISVVIGYHRVLTHKVAKLKPWLERLLVCLALPAGPPVFWVANHRKHHQYSDMDLDPHAPGIHGFWYAHNGWYLNIKNPVLCFLYAIAGPIRIVLDLIFRVKQDNSLLAYAKDVQRDKFYAALSTPFWYRLVMLLHVIIPFGLIFILEGTQGLIALWITLVIIYNLGDSVNSLCHIHESENEKKKTDTAKNLKLLSLLTFGDALHQVHHKNPRLANLGINGELDLAYEFLKIFSRLGWASNIKELKR